MLNLFSMNRINSVGTNDILDDREVIGYVRVSTDLQDIGKQKDTILHWARREKLKITKFEGIEISSSRSLLDRRLGFLNSLKSGDILVCTETSRLSRTVVELLTMVDDLLRRGVRVVFILQGLDLKDLSNPTTKLTLQMFSVMAEHERSVVSQRTKEALRVLKERGIKLGKAFGVIQRSIFDRHKDKIKEWCKDGFPYRCQARALNLSHVGLIHYVRTRKIYRGKGLR